jgi:hypothetical protein
LADFDVAGFAVDDLVLRDLALADFVLAGLVVVFARAEPLLEDLVADGLRAAALADLPLADRATSPLLTVVCLRVLFVVRELRALRAFPVRSGRFHPMARSARKCDGIRSTPSP